MLRNHARCITRCSTALVLEIWSFVLKFRSRNQSCHSVQNICERVIQSQSACRFVATPNQLTLSSVSALNMGCPPNVVILCPMIMNNMNMSLDPWDASRAGWMELWLVSFFKFRLAEKHRNAVSNLDSFFVAGKHMRFTWHTSSTRRMTLLYECT